MGNLAARQVRRGQRLYLHPHAPSMGGPCLIVSPKLWDENENDAIGNGQGTKDDPVSCIFYYLLPFSVTWGLHPTSIMWLWVWIRLWLCGWGILRSQAIQPWGAPMSRRNLPPVSSMENWRRKNGKKIYNESCKGRVGRPHIHVGTKKDWPPRGRLLSAIFFSKRGKVHSNLPPSQRSKIEKGSILVELPPPKFSRRQRLEPWAMSLWVDTHT